MKKIGLMGGTFNPIHNGHLLLAEWAMEAENLDEVWFIPTGISYSKAYENVVSGTERLHMVNLAIAGNPSFHSSDIEIRRDGYTYTYETVETLHEQFPEYKFFFIVGADCLKSFGNWKEPARILEACSILAAVRGDVSLEELEAQRKYLIENLGGKINLFSFLNLEISSTEIRERVRQGKSIRYLLPPSVADYITEKGFYHE